MKHFFCISMLVALQLLAGAQAPVTIPGSQVYTLTSNVLQNQAYALQIMLPADFGKTDKKYPILYLLDSQWDFPLVTALYGQQYYDGFVPSMIIVGITWTGKYANPDSLRARDYTPTNVKETPQSGGADRFLNVLKTEVFPLIESRYPVDKSNRTLMGCSLGGLFTVYTFFTQPGLFQNYVAASPAIGWDKGVIGQFEKRYASNQNHPPARLYLCEGGVERGLPMYQNFVSTLRNRHYKNLQLQSQVLENIGHSGTKGQGYEHGLQFAFEKPRVQLTAAQLQKLAGTYKTNDGLEATLQTNGKNLVILFSGNNPYTLAAASENELYATAEFLMLHITHSTAQKVTGFVLERYGGSQRFFKTTP